MAREICRRLAEGESLKAICADEHIAARSTVLDWVVSETPEEFADMYARARAAQVESQIDELIELADNTAEDPNSRRIRVDTRKWIAAKLLHGKYGEKFTAQVEDLTPAGLEIQVVDAAAAVKAVEALLGPLKKPAAKKRG